MAQVDAPDNERADVLLVTHADGTSEEVAIPVDQGPKILEVALTPETIEALGAAIAAAIKP